jgi:hypothetical protein
MDESEVMAMVFVKDKGCKQYIFKARPALVKWANKKPWNERHATCVIAFVGCEAVGDIRALVSIPSLPAMLDELFEGFTTKWV